MTNAATSEYKLDKMSEEQEEFYKAIRDGHNAIGDACAGSGKSTTILSIASLMPETEFIQLTYNSMLASEIKEKVDKLKLTNLRVFTYHSLVVRYYVSNGYTDTVIRQVIRQDIPPRNAISKAHVLVIDEAQDMTFLYFKMVAKFCKDMGEKVQLLVLGDFKQGLYEFKGSDTRFLTCADQLWQDFAYLKTPVFHKLTLKMSYRITNQMADFVNNAMLGEKRLHACRDGPPVVYIRRDNFNAEKFIVHKIKHLISSGEAKPSDFFVLGGSVKGQKSAIRRIENVLVQNNIPCFVPAFENEKIDERVIDGKVVFTTFHSVKGRQRKYVFIVGFDNSYFKFYCRNQPENTCPNTMYVACTRATHGLYVIERSQMYYDQPLKFLKMDHGEMVKSDYVDFKGIPQFRFHKDERKEEKVCKHYVTPTDLIRFVPESVIEEILPIIESIFIRMSPEVNEYTTFDIPGLIHTKRGFYEDVCDLNGIAMPMMYFETYMDEKMSGEFIHNLIKEYFESPDSGNHDFLKGIYDKMPKHCETVSDYLKLTNLYVSIREKLYFKLNQIDQDEYTWLQPSIIHSCFERMNEVLQEECVSKTNDGNLQFIAEVEKTIAYVDDKIVNKINAALSMYFPGKQFFFTARVDLCTPDCIWEIKCATEITNDHFMQVVIYAWLWRIVWEDMETLTNIRDFKLFNIKTGEIYLLDATTEQLNNIVIALLRAKYGTIESKEDGDFIEQCNKIISEYNTLIS